MAEHKFAYTVSGIELSEAQQTKIAQGIAAAVTSVITGHSPDRLEANFYLSNLHRFGGFIISPDPAQAVAVEKIFNTNPPDPR